MEERHMGKDSEDLSYYRLYLKKFLTEEGDFRAADEEFLSCRADAAEEEYQAARKEGLTVDQSHERAMAVLTKDLDS